MKPNLTNIKNIIFDLGKVLLNLNFNTSIKAFKNLGLKDDVLNRQQAFINPVFYELETGVVTPEKFRTAVKEILNNQDITDRQIDEAWCAMIKDIPVNRVEMLKRLSENYKIYLFSNTNAIHIEFLQKNFMEIYGFDFSSLFTQVFYSHEINERKPDLTSFQKVINLSGVEPAETLFIDDLEANIEGAKMAGLKTLWLKDGMEVTDLF